MGKGQMIYLALSVLTGTVLALHLPWGAFFLSINLLLHITRKLPPFPLLLSFLLLFSAFIYSSYRMNAASTKLSPSQTEYFITFLKPPLIDGDRLSGEVEVNGTEKVVLRIKIPDEDMKRQLEGLYYTGLSCHVIGELAEPGRSRNENGFDYAGYLYSKKTYWILTVNNFTPGTCVFQQQSPFETIVLWREKGIKAIRDNFPEKAAGLVSALVFGDRGHIEDETLKAYQRLGIIHLLAISGLHVGMMFAMLYILMLRAGIVREYVYLILLLALPLYVILTGGAPPVVRAASLMAAVMLARLLKLNITASDALSLVFILCILYEPLLLNNIGFQLSFLVSFSLVLSSPILLKPGRSNIMVLFLVSAVCQIASIPLLLWHFYEFSIIGLFINSVYVPLFTIVLLPLSLISFVALLVFPPINILFFPLLNGFVLLSDYTSLMLNTLPYISFTAGKPGGILLVVYIGVVLFFFIMGERGKWGKSVLPLFLVLIFHQVSPFINPYGEMIMIDVGQGDSFLIRLPFNEGVYMIDTGGTIDFPEEPWQKGEKEYSISSGILLPLLKSKGIDRIDKLILTHSDIDHAGTAVDLMDEISVIEILISPGSEKSTVMKEVIEKAKKLEVEVRHAQAGVGWSENHGDFLFLYPFDDHYEGNNDSLVLYGNFGGKTWLFTGDLEEAGERELATEWDFDIDVLKVGHHGSSTSTTEPFLAAVEPETALISAGVKNSYGHPSPAVTGRLKERGIRIYNTAEHGGVHYKFLGRKGTFITVIP